MTQPLLKVIINTNTSRVQIQNPPKKQQQPQKENEILERIKAVEEEVGLEASDDKDTVHLRLREIELKDLMLETDSPYLTPHPFRGQENSPKYIGFVAKEIAKLKNIPYDSVCMETSKNAREFFNLS